MLLHHCPGHVLISPVRVVQRFAELTPEEVSDLWSLAQLVGKTLEPHYKASSLTLAIQVRLYVCVYTGRLHPTCCAAYQSAKPSAGSVWLHRQLTSRSGSCLLRPWAISSSCCCCC